VSAVRGVGAAGVALGAALAALGVSVYLTIEHYDRSITLACPENSTINCAKVTTSKWSEVAGVPVAVAGLAYFAVMTAVLVLALRTPMWSRVAVAGAAVGVLGALYLVGVELFAVDAICLWCTAVHVLTLVLFAAVLWRHTGALDGAWTRSQE
jgi:uncharacterized membrane protein